MSELGSMFITSKSFTLHETRYREKSERGGEEWGKRAGLGSPQWAPYVYIWSEIFRSPDRAKSEAKYGGHGGSKLRRFQSPCAIFTIHVNMKDRVGRLRRRKLGPPLTAIFGFTRWPEDLTPDIYRAHWFTYGVSNLINIIYTIWRETWLTLIWARWCSFHFF